MEGNSHSAVTTELARRLRQARGDIATRWLDAISARVRMSSQDVFPTQDLLDHVPMLIRAIADFVEDPAEDMTTDVPVIAKAMELGELRHGQGFDAIEILDEYELLGNTLYEFAKETAATCDVPYEAADLIECGHRIFAAVSAIEKVTTEEYLRALSERVGDREDQLRRFNRMITHELKNRVGATLGAGQLLQEEWLGDEERKRFGAMVADNANVIQTVIEDLVALSRVDEERRTQRNAPLRDVVSEVFRQLEELARAREVELRVDDELPEIEVNAAAVELCLSNYLSNAIKYSDTSASERWAAVSASVDPDRGEVVVRVRDNGMGVAPEQRPHLFDRYFRGQPESSEGTGLGLSLVLETVQGLGGRAWAEFDDGPGSVFAFALPHRRGDEDTDQPDDVSDADAAAGPDENPRQFAERGTESD